jgi:hypothetical protein
MSSIRGLMRALKGVCLTKSKNLTVQSRPVNHANIRHFASLLKAKQNLIVTLFDRNRREVRENEANSSAWEQSGKIATPGITWRRHQH